MEKDEEREFKNGGRGMEIIRDNNKTQDKEGKIDTRVEIEQLTRNGR